MIILEMKTTGKFGAHQVKRLLLSCLTALIFFSAAPEAMALYEGGQLNLALFDLDTRASGSMISEPSVAISSSPIRMSFLIP